MFLLQPISLSRGWQAKASHKCPVLLSSLLVCLGKGAHENPTFFSWLCCCPPALRHPMENWGGWVGAGCLGGRERGGTVLAAPLTMGQIRSCLR